MRVQMNLLFAALVCLSGMGVVSAHSEEKKDPSRIDVLYSAEDDLCKPLAAAYNRLNHTHSQNLDWERGAVDVFQAIGLREPEQLKDMDLPDEVGGGDLRQVYYSVDLTGNGQRRIVFIDDQCVGRCDEFSTIVWILRPGDGVKLKEYKWPDAGGRLNKWDLLDPSIISSAISFDLKPKPQDIRDDQPIYPTIYGPRFLDKIATGEDKELSLLERLGKSIAKPYIHGNLSINGGSGPLVQQVWSYKGKTYFTARELGFGGPFGIGVLVYRYVAENSIEDVCYLSSSDAGLTKRLHDR